MHYMYANETQREKATLELQKNTTCCLEQILVEIPNKTAALWPPAFHLTTDFNKTN